jgi:hypothetical protein
MSPGAGAGNEAMADATIKALLPGLHKVLTSYTVGSPKYKAVLNALRALTANFGDAQENSMVPAAIQQLAQTAKGGGKFGAAPPMPLQAATPPPMGGPGEAPPI